MRKLKQLDLTEYKIWKDKRVKPEAKIIYSYIYSKGYDRVIINLNVGELQQVVRISNQGLRKNLKKLEDYKYLLFKEYSNGMYTIKLLG